MDKDVRNRIQRATQNARAVLEQEYGDQLEGLYDIHKDGSIVAEPGVHLDDHGRLVREKLVAAIGYRTSAGSAAAESVAEYLRETSFTSLNRFVALKLLEGRGLLQECVSSGDQSSGFKEFGGLAPGLVRLPDRGYQLYLESLFDEIGQEVGVLFDRRDPASLLWPRRQALLDLLDILNDPDLREIWSEDETIGWVYQYFNSAEERKKMRDESQAPRNSRELAVRNQFFTPRYVVRFLADNTLGRIWVEMQGDKTQFHDRCEYLVWRPDQPVRPRPRKDPRDLRVLDPACGSGHFLLYAFDLLTAIYEEAWADEAFGATSQATGTTLREDYPDLMSLRQATPAMIVENNLYGVDIDPRCAQIAAFVLWLRAQRAWNDAGISQPNRPPIAHTHIVVAEPMPGDAALVEEFAAGLAPPLFQGLFTRMIDEMRLAGELGTLMRIEHGIAAELGRAREQFVDERRRPGFLPGLEPAVRQGELDLSGIDDDQFFHEAEGRIVDALRRFAETASGGANVRRRLFVGDASQGIALIDLVRTRFDVVVMNPPFGDASRATRQVIRTEYPSGANDLFAVFVERGLELLCPSGLLGCISSRTGFFASSLRKWRTALFRSGITVMADLGQGVMDGATVEAAAYCVGARQDPVVVRLLTVTEKASALLRSLGDYRDETPNSRVFSPDRDAFRLLPDSPFAYWVSREILEQVSHFPGFEPDHGAVRKGLRTGDNHRFVRAYWEVAPTALCTDGTDAKVADGWVPLVMTGASQPWFAPIYLVLNWHRAGRELRAYVLKYGVESRLIQAKDYYFKPGFSWTLRASRLFPYWVPPGCIFTGSRPMAFPVSTDAAPATLGLYASRVVSAYLRLYGEWFSRPKFLEGNLKVVPVPELDGAIRTRLENAVVQGISAASASYSRYEPFLEFRAPSRSVSSDGGEGLGFDPRSLLPAELELDVASAYGLSRDQLTEFCRDLDEALAFAGWRASTDEDEDDGAGDAVVLTDSPEERARRLVSYGVGCALGRWDLRRATEDPDNHQVGIERVLPSKPPGLLVGDDGRHPARAVPSHYPIDVALDGLLVEDPGHQRDIGRAVTECLDALDVTEESTLAAAFAGKVEFSSDVWREFWRWHIDVYSLGRRKAPIYWRLGTRSGSYAVWLYIHACTRDTLFKVQSELVMPKLAHEERRLEAMRSDLGSEPRAAERKQLAALEIFTEELRGFLEELRRVAPLWSPHLDDGVVINFALLWRLVPHHTTWQRELKRTWDTLCAGEYDWAHLSMHLWPERVIPKCAADRSLAIAHGLEELLWLEEENGTWTPRRGASGLVEEVVRQRTSDTVKDGLEELREAPVVKTSRTRRTKAV